jgi:arabinofuranan 3-O-arabinosyltransferase
VWRLRHVAICVALTAIAFLQDPGLIVLDTKVDLTVDPIGWLDRALHLWYPSSQFGQVQNQAYGYLWPMGPFFVAGFWLDLPEWVIQRLWWALVMCVAYLGVVKLSRRLGIGTPFARAVAGVAFALSPRVLTELGTISIEAWPMALAPWVLIPLIGLREGGSIRRSVTLSALAVACVGGVNATAALAVVPMALLWLGMLPQTRRRSVAISAWIGAVAAATAWWVVPLLLLGRYSPPFLDYIENAQVTTRITDLVNVTRGTSHWLAYLSGPYGPLLPAGHRLATEPLLIAATLAVAGLGLAGLARPGMPHRRFLVTSFLAGLALVGMGHATAIDGGVASVVREFLDGPGAPLRNVHKFDVVLRLPLVLGLAHLIGVMARSAAAAGRGLHVPGLRAAAVSAGVVVALAGTVAPAVAGVVPTHGSYRAVPGYWSEATDWLDAHVGNDRVLVVPAARFPTYTWGRPSDEIIQALMSRPWAVRNANPLTPPATVRLLDSIESALATGAGSAGLADVLARSGIRYVLLRSDLDYGRSGAARPIVVRQALTRSPGLRRVVGFGPQRGGVAQDHSFVDNGFDVPVQTLEVFEVERPVAPVVAYDAAAATTVVGGPEALLDMAATGHLSPAPAILAGDLPDGAPVGQVVVTDTLRRREVAFGLPQDNASSTMTGTQPFKLDSPSPDYLPGWATSRQTVVRHTGINGVTASSSWADAASLVGSRPEYQPYAALDGDVTTSWRTSPTAPVVGQWLEIGLADATVVSEVDVRIDPGADNVATTITVRAGLDERTVDLAGVDVTVSLPGRHPVSRIRIIVNAVAELRTGAGGVGISEVGIPGVTPGRTLVVPAPPRTAAPPAVVLSTAPSVASCFFAVDRTRCAPGVARGSEDAGVIDRTVTLPVGGHYRPSLWARPRAGTALSEVIDREFSAATPLGLLPLVTASSFMVPDPAGRPGAVLDGDPSTAWSPAVGDRNPWLRLNWLGPRTINGLRLTLAPGVAGTPPAAVTVVGDDGIRSAFVNATGSVLFDRPMRTDEISVVFPERPPLVSYEPYGNSVDLLPIAVGELTALPDLPNWTVPLDVPVSLPCGSGPTVDIEGMRVRTELVATRRDLLELREVPARPCDEDPAALSLPVDGGQRRIVVAPSDLAEPTRLRLAPAGEPAAVGTTEVRVDQWSATRRLVHVAPHATDQILAVRENVNAGWHASAGGLPLRPIVVDGWQQGWLVPAGVAGEVVLSFAPDGAYRAGLIGGGVAALAVLLMALIRPRRPGTHSRARTPVRPMDDGPRRSARPSVIVPSVCGAVALLLLGGVGAAVLMALGLLALWALRWGPVLVPSWEHRWRPRAVRAALWWAPVVGFGLAAWAWSATRDDRASALPQLVALATATALWLSVAVRRRRGTRLTPQR